MITICIPTIPEREDKLLRLLSRIERKMETIGATLYTYSTPHIRDGGDSIGAKRNEMLKSVKTEYVAFIDDDDMPSETYFDNVQQMISDNVDALGFRGIMTTNGLRPVEFVHSCRYSWHDAPAWVDGSKRYIRPLNHLNPIRTSIAAAIGYKDMTHGEDRDYAERLKTSGLVKTELFADEFLYHYIFKNKK